jgi:hypothetical protein
MKSALAVLIMLPLVSLVVSVLLYAMNRSRYKQLISDFQKKHTLPTPYLLHCNMGYIGSPLMTYFFVRLTQNKKIFFLDINDDAYGFAFEGENLKKINSLKPLFYTFSFGFTCFLLLILIAIKIKLTQQ